MKKLASAGEVLVEIMAERIGQSLLEAGPLAGPFPSGAPAIFIGQAASLGQPAALGERPIPRPLISQYLAHLDPAVAAGRVSPTAPALVRASVRRVLEIYADASGASTSPCTRERGSTSLKLRSVSRMARNVNRCNARRPSAFPGRLMLTRCACR